MGDQKVAPKTRIIGGSSSRLIGLPPSITLATTMTTSAPPTPIGVARIHQPSVLAASAGDRAGRSGARTTVPRRGARWRRRAHGSRSIAALRAMTSARWRRIDVDDLVERLDDDVLRAVDQRDDRVGGGVDALDQVAVEHELRARETRERDHGCTVLGPCRERRPWPTRGVFGGPGRPEERDGDRTECRAPAPACGRRACRRRISA